MTWSRKPLSKKELDFRAEIKINKRHTVCELQKQTIRYARVLRGLKKCVTCEVVWDSKHLHCPCCGRKLRMVRRDKPDTSKNPSPDLRPRY